MSLAALMMSLILTTSATAQRFPAMAAAAAVPAQVSCPEGGTTVATATFNAVTINGQQHPVRGRNNRTRFATMLLQCGHHDAAVLFDQWRLNRRLTNATAGVGVLAFAPALLAAPVTAINAGMKRRQMLATLNQPNQSQQPGLAVMERAPAAANPFVPEQEATNPFLLAPAVDED